MPVSSNDAKMAPKLVPKHMKQDASSRISVLLPRPKRRKLQYFVARESGELFREWVQRNLEDSLGCYILDFVMALLALFVVVFNAYVYWNGVLDDAAQWIKAVDFNINLLFTIEYIVRLYATFDRVDYARTLLPAAELVVLFPAWLRFIAELEHLDYVDSLDQVKISIMLRSLRVLRLFRFLEFTRSSLERQLLAVLLTIICIVIATAGILQVLETCYFECFSDAVSCKCQNLSYIDLLYFVVVSISTLGYGDIAPVSTNGKFLISFIILLTFIVVPIQINRVSTTISSHTDYTSSYTEAKQHPHVVITGHVDVEMLCVFFGEFFHPSNLNWNEKVVILNPSPPAVEVKKMLNAYENKVKYIVGSPMLDEDLDRAVLHKASACYVLVNRNATRPQHADQCSALITIALRRGNPTCPIYAQVINAENAGTILKMGASDVIVAGLMKFSILGRSCEMCGLPTLLLNLLAQCHSDLDTRVSPIQWQKFYLHGFMHGVFVADIPRTFSGLSFGDLIKFLYEKTPVVPLALLTEEGVQFPDMEFKLGATADPNLCCKVYAIAKGLTAVEQVLQIPPEQILSYRKNTRRKAKSMVDLYDNEVVKKNSKPALGSEFEKIRQSLIASYKAPEKHNTDEDSTDYVDFTSAGVPSDIAKHIIVCGFPTDTYQFLKTIREAPLMDEELGSPPVVFLAPAVIDEDDFAKIKHFPDVYFVMGSPVNFVDLKKTRIDVAMSVLILTQTTESPYSDPNMIDADAITTLRYIVEISQKTSMPNLVVELDKPTNVKLLSSLSNDHLSVALLKAQHTVNRQISYRTPRRASHRRDSFWGGLDESTTGGSDASLVLEEYIASGRVYMNSIIDSLMSECYRKPWITQFFDILINGSHNDPEKRRLFQLEAPEELVTSKYSSCFRKFLEMTNCIAVGIWRPARGIILPHPCVFINPPPDLEVEAGDLFFLIPPGVFVAEIVNKLKADSARMSMERLEEIVALDALSDADADAQQHFHTLEFPAQHGSKVMKYLAMHFQSLSEIGFAHLKRMKKHPEQKSALVALITPYQEAGDDGQLVMKVSEMEQLFQARVSSAYVLKHAPKTREAFDTHTRAWPLIFHASVLPEAQAEPIEDDEALVMAAHLRSALAFAEQFERATGVDKLDKLPFCCAHGCVIVDPQHGTKQQHQRVIADSFTHRKQGSYAFQPIFHPVMIAVDGVAERDRQRNGPSPKKQKREGGDADEEGHEEVGAAVEEEEESYLCTGYDVYMDREPCVMCAMALIHSRARRVVFVKLNATDGALASAHRLHTIKSLNHHYRVFHLRLADNGETGESAANTNEA